MKSRQTLKLSKLDKTYVTGFLNYRGNYDSVQIATNDKDVHNAFLFQYIVDSFAFIFETKCRF